MRARTPRPAERSEPGPGPNDDAYLEYGSLTESKSRSRGRGRGGGSGDGRNGWSWKRVAGVTTVATIPVGLLLLSSIWTNASEETVLSPAQLALRKKVDQKVCDAEARVESNTGLRRDARAWDRCMVDLGWRLDANSQPVECVGSCRVRELPTP